MALATILSAVRTPIGRFLGGLSAWSGVELGELAVRAALERAAVAPSEIDLVFLGNARPAGLGPNPARQVAWRAGVPVEVPATTINMACASSLQAILLGVQAIQLGRARTVLVGGLESMSNVPYLLPRARAGYRLGHAPVVDAMYQDGFHCPLADQLMGETAETLAREYAISRQEQDEFALTSHLRAAAAQSSGSFAAETVAVPARGKTPAVSLDEHVRADTSLAKLAQLPAVFASGGRSAPATVPESPMVPRHWCSSPPTTCAQVWRRSKTTKWPASIRVAWGWDRCRRRVGSSYAPASRSTISHSWSSTRPLPRRS